MDVRGPHHIGSKWPDRISPWLDCLELIATVDVGLEECKTLEVGIQRGRVAISEMYVASVTVRLPYLELCSAHRFALDVQHSAHDVEDLTCSTTGAPGHAGQVAAEVGRLHGWIKGPNIWSGVRRNLDWASASFTGDIAPI